MSNDLGNFLASTRRVRTDVEDAQSLHYLRLGAQVFRVDFRSTVGSAQVWDPGSGGWAAVNLTHSLREGDADEQSDRVTEYRSLGALFVRHKGAGDSGSTVFTTTLPGEGAPVWWLGEDDRFHPIRSWDGKGSGPLGQLLSWGDRLLVADRAFPSVWMSDDPISGRWYRLGDPSWPSRGNLRTSILVAGPDHLSVFLDNSRTGFEFWRSDATGTRWQQIIATGAYRFRRNARVTAAALLGETILFAAASDSTSPFASGRSSGFELLVADTAGEWVVLCGDCRCTPSGLQAPMLACGAGFDRNDDATIAKLVVASGRLVALTGQRRVWCAESNNLRLVLQRQRTSPLWLLADASRAWLVSGDEGWLHVEQIG